MGNWIGSAASDKSKESVRDGFCPCCGAKLPEDDTILGDDYRAVYSNHANSGTFTAGVKIETQNEELYRKNKQAILELIEEIDKA